MKIKVPNPATIIRHSMAMPTTMPKGDEAEVVSLEEQKCIVAKTLHGQS